MDARIDQHMQISKWKQVKKNVIISRDTEQMLTKIQHLPMKRIQKDTGVE